MMGTVRRPRLFTIAAALSLVIFSATVVLWVRGHWQCDQVDWSSADYCLSLASANSLMSVMFGPQYKGNGPARQVRASWQYRHYSAHYDGQETIRCQVPLAEYRRLGWLGFAYDPNRLQTYNGPPKMVWYSSYRFYFPSWSLAAAATILPAAWCLRRRRARARAARGHCENCGYDLRATPAEGGPLLGRCPECGAVPPPAPLGRRIRGRDSFHRAREGMEFD